MLILIFRYKDHINNHCIKFHIVLYCVVVLKSGNIHPTQSWSENATDPCERCD
jgi:hypothetical protein